MTVILPVSLAAQESAAAMLQSNGGVLVNHSQVPASVAILLHDLVETQPNIIARLEVSGSTADLSPETIVEFEGDELVLDHGSVTVNTARGLRVRAGCITVTPVNPDWTYYTVEDKDGKVTVTALRNDVYIDEHRSKSGQVKEEVKSTEHSGRTIVHEGERKSRSEKCGGALLKQGITAPVEGEFMNNPWVVGGAVVIVGGITCFALCRSDDPISPKDP